MTHPFCRCEADEVSRSNLGDCRAPFRCSQWQ